MRVSILIPDLRGGGAEHVASVLAAFLCSEGHDVTLVTYVGPEQDRYALPSGVRRMRLPAWGGTRPSLFASALNAVGRLWALRRHYVRNRTDVAVGFMSQPNALVALAALGTRVAAVGSVHSFTDKEKVSWPWRALFGIAAWRMRALVFVSGCVDKTYPWSRPSRTEVIYNPVHLPHALVWPQTPRLNKPTFDLAVIGRLVPLKGQALAIRALPLLADDVHLSLLGEGPDRPALEALAASLNVQHRVHFYGWCEDIFSRLACVDVVVCTSTQESFGNALVQAMFAGLPVISVGCAGGPAEIVEDGKTGLLIEGRDPEALALSVERLRCDRGLRHRMGAAARARAQARFEPRALLASWQRLLQEAARP